MVTAMNIISNNIITHVIHESVGDNKVVKSPEKKKEISGQNLR